MHVQTVQVKHITIQHEVWGSSSRIKPLSKTDENVLSGNRFGASEEASRFVDSHCTGVLVVVVVQYNESPLKQHAIRVEVFLVANEVKVFPKVKKKPLNSKFRPVAPIISTVHSYRYHTQSRL